MDTRLKKLRKELRLTQQEFANRLKIKRGAVANYEIGRNVPIDAVVSLICKEFRVNRDWLLTGKGGENVIFDDASESDIDKILKELKPEARDRILIEKFLELSEDGRQAVMRYALSVAAAAQKEIQGSAVHKDSTEAAEADYRSSLDIALNTGLSASNTTDGTASQSDKQKGKTTEENGGGESGDDVG